MYMTPSTIYQNFTKTPDCMMMCGLYQYTYRDFCLTYGVYDFFTTLSNSDKIAKLDDYYAQKETDPDNEMTGIFKDKNLFLVQLEAIDTWMLTEEVMPNLWGLKEKSIDFVNNFAPIYQDGHTFSTESIVNTGLISPYIGSSSTVYTDNSYPFSLANLFRKAGFSANSYHRSTSMYNPQGACELGL